MPHKHLVQVIAQDHAVLLVQDNVQDLVVEIVKVVAIMVAQDAKVLVKVHAITHVGVVQLFAIYKHSKYENNC